MENYFGNRDSLSQYREVGSRQIYSSGRRGGTRLTVAIPTYKRPALLREALESIRRQTVNGEDYEVLVVDNDPDGDDAAVREMLAEFRFSNCAYFRNARNIGMFGNWNRCLELAASEWMTILNDDDCLSTDYMREMLSGLRMDSRAFLTCNAKLLIEGEASGDRRHMKDMVSSIAVHASGENLRRISVGDYFLRNCNMGSLGILFHRASAVELGGFNPDWFPAADYVFFCIYTYRYGGFRLQKPLSVYRFGCNESLKYSTFVQSVRVVSDFRRYLARHVLKSRVGSFFSDMVSVAEMRRNGRILLNFETSQRCLKQLHLPRVYNNVFCEALVRMFFLLREFLKKLGLLGSRSGPVEALPASAPRRAS